MSIKAHTSFAFERHPARSAAEAPNVRTQIQAVWRGPVRRELQQQPRVPAALQLIRMKQQQEAPTCQ
jgi:hypothetical protein